MDKRLSLPLNELHSALKKLYGDKLDRIVLFGSYARGTATDESDVDILVVLDGEIRPGEEIRRLSEVTTPVSVGHDIMISVLPVSKQDFEQKQGALLSNIRREGIEV